MELKISGSAAEVLELLVAMSREAGAALGVTAGTAEAGTGAEDAEALTWPCITAYYVMSASTQDAPGYRGRTLGRYWTLDKARRRAIDEIARQGDGALVRIMAETRYQDGTVVSEMDDRSWRDVGRGDPSRYEAWLRKPGRVVRQARWDRTDAFSERS